MLKPALPAFPVVVLPHTMLHVIVDTCEQISKPSNIPVNHVTIHLEKTETCMIFDKAVLAAKIMRYAVQIRAFIHLVSCFLAVYFLAKRC